MAIFNSYVKLPEGRFLVLCSTVCSYVRVYVCTYKYVCACAFGVEGFQGLGTYYGSMLML